MEYAVIYYDVYYSYFIIIFITITQFLITMWIIYGRFTKIYPKFQTMHEFLTKINIKNRISHFDGA